MTAPVGTDSFTSVESQASEDKQKMCAITVIGNQSYWSLGHGGISVNSICESVGNKNIYGKIKPETRSGKKQDKSSFMVSDGGDIVCWQNGQWIPYGMLENKWQKNLENAIERCWRYINTLLLVNVWPFYIFDGPGFDKELMLASSSSTGSTYEQIRALEKKSNGLIKVLLCPDKEEAEKEFKAWLDRLEKYSKLSKDEQIKIRHEVFATFSTVKYEGTLLGASLMSFMIGTI